MYSVRCCPDNRKDKDEKTRKTVRIKIPEKRAITNIAHLSNCCGESEDILENKKYRKRQAATSKIRKLNKSIIKEMLSVEKVRQKVAPVDNNAGNAIGERFQIADIS